MKKVIILYVVTKILEKKYNISSSTSRWRNPTYALDIYIPVIHTKDKEGKEIDKICCRNFGKVEIVSSNYKMLFWIHYFKGFELERGLLVEETGAKHEKIENLKKITNFENTKRF